MSSLVPLASQPNGTLLRAGTFLPAAGATAYVYEHAVAPAYPSRQVTVQRSETDATPLAQPLTADANGQLPGWIPATALVDIVASYGTFTAPPAEMIAAGVLGDPGAPGLQGIPGLTITSNPRGPYNPLTVYSAGPPPDAVLGSDGAWYYSLVSGNVGHNPVGDGGVHWASGLPASVVNVGSGGDATGTGAKGYVALAPTTAIAYRLRPDVDGTVVSESVAPVPINLVPGGGTFESPRGLDPWATSGLPWGHGATISQSTSQFHSGAASMQVQTPGLGYNEGCHVVIPGGLSASMVYTFSFWAKGATGTESIYPYVYDVTNNVNYGAAPPIALTTSWQQTTFTFTQAANAPSAIIIFVNWLNTAITFYVDDVALTTPLAFSERMASEPSRTFVSLLDATFGVAGDGVTDDWPAINAAVNSSTATTIRVPSTKADGTRRTYRLSKPLRITRGVHLEADRPGAVGAIFLFDVGRHGIVLASDGATVRGISCQPAATVTTRTVTDLVVTGGSTMATSATANFTSADKGLAIVEVPGTGDAAGIPGGVSIASVVNSTTVTLDLAAFTGETLHVVIGGSCAMTLCAHAQAIDCQHGNSSFIWGGNGVHVIGHTPYSNANHCYIERVWTQNQALDGFYALGFDGNACTFLACEATQSGNAYEDFRDDSGLGNTYILCESDSGGGSTSAGGFTIGSASSGGNVNASCLVGCYVEGGRANYFGQYVIVIGGANMSGSGSGMSFGGSGGSSPGPIVTPSLGFSSPSNPKLPRIRFGNLPTLAPGGAFSAQFSSDVDADAWYLGYDMNGNVGMWSLLHGTSSDALQLPTTLDPNYRIPSGATVRFPNGLLLGSSSGGALVMQGSAAPTSGTYKQGDVVYNSAPASGGFVGWVCTTGGTPGTWKTFGLIS